MEENKGIVNFNLSNIAPLIKKEWLLFSIILFFFLGLGGYKAFTDREEFVSEGQLLPELQGGDTNLSGLANMVALGGFELGLKNSTEAIRPDLYPDIIKSTPFFLELLKIEVTDRKNKKMIFENYYIDTFKEEEEEDNKEKGFKTDKQGILILSRINEQRLEDLRERVSASIDKKSGIIAVSVKLPDPLIAAQSARFAIEYLTQYVVDYRTTKLRKELDFLAQKVAASKGKFYANQERKAEYQDAFQLPTIRLQTADVQRERIESEYRISSTFYNELLKKYEEAKLKLEQQTPIFKILEPPVVPYKKVEPKRAIILVTSGVLGIMVAFVTILFKGKNYRKLIE